MAGTQFRSGGVSAATIWTSTNAQHWSKQVLPHAAGTSTQASDAVAWGQRWVVVGSATLDGTTNAAAWVSPGPPSGFSASAMTTTTSSTTTTSTTTSTIPPGTTTGTGTPAQPTSAGLSATTTTTSAAAAPVPSVMDHVTASTLGLFAAGTVGGRAALWYSGNGQQWALLADADHTLDRDPGAVVNALISTPGGVFAAGTWADGNRTAAAIWYSPDGIHWSTVSPQAGSFGGPGDHVITALISISGTAGGPSGYLAIGGTRIGASWQPAAWISPDGFYWSPTSNAFPLSGEPPGSAGALAYAAASSAGTVFADGGSPLRQRLWVSQQGLAWSEVPLPAGAQADPAWHLGLVAADNETTVVADNLPGQPFVLVRKGTAWSEPSSSGIFGPPLTTATPTSLISAGGRLLMSVDIDRPSLDLGHSAVSSVVLSSPNGQTWRRLATTTFAGAQISQLLAVPQGVLAIGVGGTNKVPPLGTRTKTLVTKGPFVLLSTDRGASWSNPGAEPGTPAPPGTELEAATLKGTRLYVAGQARGRAVAWSSTTGTAWDGPAPLDSSPQLGQETVLGACSSTTEAVVVGDMTTTRFGTLPVAWNTSGSAGWTASTFLPAPAPGSFTTVNGCLSTAQGFIAYGETAAPGHPVVPVLWSSGDGGTWQQVSTSFTGPTGGRTVGPQGAPFDDMVAAPTTWIALSGAGDLPNAIWPAPVGGRTNLGPLEPGVWASDDSGDSWQQLATSAPAFAAAYYTQADQALFADGEPIVAGTVDGSLAVWAGAQPPAVAGTTTAP